MKLTTLAKSISAALIIAYIPFTFASYTIVMGVDKKASHL